MNFDHSSGEYLNIESANIYYEIKGNEKNPVLLFLHGGFGNIEDFNELIQNFEQEYRIIGIDSRGQGKSTLGSSKLSYEQIQKDVIAILNKLGIDTLSIIGLSDGGIVAYRIASLTSLNILKLVTIGSRWHIKNTEQSRELFLNVTGESWRKKFPHTYEDYQRLNPEPSFDILAKSLVNMWLDSDSSGYINEKVKNISCPLLIIRGDQDHLLSRKAVVELADLVENSNLLNIPFAGHVAFESHKELFMKSVNEFLKI
jgi:pimeloyl-ACP methyl ester carboxylesterase